MNIAIKMKKLNPPKNYREITPRVCAYCERYIEIDPVWTCERWFDYKKLEHHTFRDMRDKGQYTSTCDYYKFG